MATSNETVQKGGLESWEGSNLEVGNFAKN